MTIQNKISHVKGEGSRNLNILSDFRQSLNSFQKTSTLSFNNQNALTRPQAMLIERFRNRNSSTTSDQRSQNDQQ